MTHTEKIEELAQIQDILLTYPPSHPEIEIALLRLRALLKILEQEQHTMNEIMEEINQSIELERLTSQN